METTESTTMMPPPIPGKARPTFLTVICILTFIGSGWGVISSATQYFTADTRAAVVNESLSRTQDQMGSDSPGILKNMMGSVANASSPSNLRKAAVISLLSCLLTLGGAIMMFSLKKTGFYIYIAGIVVSVIVPMIILGGFVGGMAAMFGGFIGLIFIIMYGVNLKYMS